MEEETKIEKARHELPNRNLDRVTDAFAYVTLIVTLVAFWGYKFEQGDYPVFWSLFSFSLVLLVNLVRPSSLLDRHVHFPELEQAVLRSRTGFPEIPRVDLRREGFFEFAVGRRATDHVVSGIAATLARQVKEPVRVGVTNSFPFPAQCMREDLVAAIIYSGGISRLKAERLFDALAASICSHIKEVSDSRTMAVEIFPIGLYENITSEGARFSPQLMTLKRGYPELQAILAQIESGKAAR